MYCNCIREDERDVFRKKSDQVFLEGTCIDLSALHRPVYERGPKEKENYKEFISLKAFSDPFVAAIEAVSQSSSSTRAKLHKVEAAEEGLLLSESAEYTASQAHRPTPVPTTHPSFPLLGTQAMLRFLPKIIFFEIK
jgi:hypothetical protein